MNSGEFWILEQLSDDALSEQLMRLLASGARTEARIVAHVAEVEDRRLHLRCGCSSLFEYCVQRLGLSESEAFHRLTAARLARRFPLIFQLIEERKIHLTGVCLLRDYLNDENHAELLAEACGKTKLQVLELLARRNPRPDVASTLRKLPERVGAPPAPSKALASLPEAVSTLPNPMPAPVAQERKHTARLEPTAPERYRLQLNVTAALREKLDLARALLSHAVPDGDLAVVVERALDELLGQLRKKRFAETSRPRVRTTQQRRKGNASHSAKRREHITHATRREIAERDGLRCSYQSEDGHRCNAMAFLQIHHDEPWAHGGESGSENLKMVCAAHNRLLAERDFGRERVATILREKRRAKTV